LQPTPLANEIAPAVIEGLRVIRGTPERKTFASAQSTRVFNIAQEDIAEAVHLPPLALEVGNPEWAKVIEDAAAYGECRCATGQR